MSEDYSDNLPELYDDVLNDEEIIDVEPKQSKKALTKRQLESMQANLKKAQEVRRKKKEQQKRIDEEYVSYDVDTQPRIRRVNPRDEPQYDDDDYSDEEPEPQPRRRSQPQPQQRKLTKKDLKEIDRLDRIEGILHGLVKAQKSAKKRPVQQTIIQIPQTQTKQKPKLDFFNQN